MKFVVMLKHDPHNYLKITKFGENQLNGFSKNEKRCKEVIPPPPQSPNRVNGQKNVIQSFNKFHFPMVPSFVTLKPFF